MKTVFFYSMVCGLMIILGIFFYAYQKQFLIVYYPSSTNAELVTYPSYKRKVTLFYWKNDAWHHESVDLVLQESKVDALNAIINAWLSLMYEEQVMNKKVTLSHILLDGHEQELYLSFDRNPFTKEEPTFIKWLWVESLLKTVRENNFMFLHIHFLVQHAPLHDYHLDFSHPWPAQGFFN